MIEFIILYCLDCEKLVIYHHLGYALAQTSIKTSSKSICKSSPSQICDSKNSYNVVSIVSVSISTHSRDVNSGLYLRISMLLFSE